MLTPSKNFVYPTTQLVNEKELRDFEENIGSIGDSLYDQGKDNNQLKNIIK